MQRITNSKQSTYILGQASYIVYSRRFFASGSVPATSYTLIGPSTGTVNVQSTPYTVTLSPNGGTSANVTITLASTIAGNFSSPSVTLSTATPTATFTYTPTVTGTATISTTNNLSLTNATSLSYVVTSIPQDTAPVFSPVNGSTIGQGRTVIISGGFFGSSYYYTITTDGSTPAIPTTGSTLYTRPITVNVLGTTKISAISHLAGDTDSAPISVTYTINVNSMAVTVVRFEPAEHSLTLNLGLGTEINVRHLSDQQIVDIRSAYASGELANDTNGLPIDQGN